MIPRMAAAVRGLKLNSVLKIRNKVKYQTSLSHESAKYANIVVTFLMGVLIAWQLKMKKS